MEWQRSFSSQIADLKNTTHAFFFSKLNNLLSHILPVTQIYFYINNAYQQITKKARQVGEPSRFVFMLGCFMHLAEAGCNWDSIYYIML